MEVKIRAAVVGDAGAIADIHVQSWQQVYRGLLPQEFLHALDPERRAVGWRELIAAQEPPGRVVVVIAERDAILGFAHVCPTRDDDEQGSFVGELTAIYLHPTAWGQGLGRQLLGSAVELLREAGNRAATLWVLQGNIHAIGFYQANGWDSDGSIKHATIGDAPVTEIRYRMTL